MSQMDPKQFLRETKKFGRKFKEGKEALKNLRVKYFGFVKKRKYKWERVQRAFGRAGKTTQVGRSWVQVPVPAKDFNL